MNFLHLNHGKGFWTWFADLYAVGLAILACTGIFIITGKKGLGGRGRCQTGPDPAVQAGAQHVVEEIVQPQAVPPARHPFGPG